jgi:hypothetical protein
MPIPIEGVGVGAISGGAVVVFLMKIVPILLRKINGNSRRNNIRINNGSKPGKSKTCIKNSNMLAGHEVLLKQLCVNQNKAEESAETARKENREDHKQIFDKLDELK